MARGIEIKNQYSKEVAEKVLEVTCDVLRIPKEEVVGTSQHADVAMARAIAQVLLREHLLDPVTNKPLLSFTEIAGMFNGRDGKPKDHTTVHHSIRKHEDEMFGNPKYREAFNSIMPCVMAYTSEQDTFDRIREIKEEISILTREMRRLQDMYNEKLKNKKLAISLEKKDNLPLGTLI